MGTTRTGDHKKGRPVSAINAFFDMTDTRERDQPGSPASIRRIPDPGRVEILRPPISEPPGVLAAYDLAPPT